MNPYGIATAALDALAEAAGQDRLTRVIREHEHNLIDLVSDPENYPRAEQFQPYHHLSRRFRPGR